MNNCMYTFVLDNNYKIKGTIRKVENNYIFIETMDNEINDLYHEIIDLYLPTVINIFDNEGKEISKDYFKPIDYLTPLGQNPYGYYGLLIDGRIYEGDYYFIDYFNNIVISDSYYNLETLDYSINDVEAFIYNYENRLKLSHMYLFKVNNKYIEGTLYMVNSNYIYLKDCIFDFKDYEEYYKISINDFKNASIFTISC